MINLKLKTIASFISKNDIVLDMGCDHGYLAIYLKENNICENVYASDINENALNHAINNFQKKNIDITTYLSNGFLNIKNSKINTVVIAGVGTNTILDILKNCPSNIKKLIISSNNNHDILRKKMYYNHWYIKKEEIVKEHDKFYVIQLFTKEKEKENNFTLCFGKSNNIEYFNYLITKEQNIIKKIPNTHILKILKHQKNIKILNKIIKRNLVK